MPEEPLSDKPVSAPLVKEAVLNEDLMSRFLVYPKSFDVTSDAIAFEGFIEFNSKDNYSDSLVWRRYAPTDEEVHEHGRKAALEKKERLILKGKPDPGIAYKGFLSALAGKIREIESDKVRLEVRPAQEEGLHHAAIFCISESAKISTGIRSDLKMKLYELMVKERVDYPSPDKEVVV